MLKLDLELSSCDGVLHRLVVILQAIHGLDLRLGRLVLVSILLCFLDRTIRFRL